MSEKNFHDEVDRLLRQQRFEEAQHLLQTRLGESEPEKELKQANASAVHNWISYGIAALFLDDIATFAKIYRLLAKRFGIHGERCSGKKLARCLRRYAALAAAVGVLLSMSGCPDKDDDDDDDKYDYIIIEPGEIPIHKYAVFPVEPIYTPKYGVPIKEPILVTPKPGTSGAEEE